MHKHNDKRKEKETREVSDFSLYDKSGRQKTFALSIVAAVVGFLSVIFSALGFLGMGLAITGILFGVGAIILSVVARVKLGYFNGFIIIGLLFGIFATVLGIFACLYIRFMPEIIKWIEGTNGNKNIEKI